MRRIRQACNPQITRINADYCVISVGLLLLGGHGKEWISATSSFQRKLAYKDVGGRAASGTSCRGIQEDGAGGVKWITIQGHLI